MRILSHAGVLSIGTSRIASGRHDTPALLHHGILIARVALPVVHGVLRIASSGRPLIISGRPVGVLRAGGRGPRIAAQLRRGRLQRVDILRKRCRVARVGVAVKRRRHRGHDGLRRRRAARYVNVFLAPRALGNAAVHLHAVHATDGAACRLLGGESHKRVAAVRKRVDARDLAVHAERAAYDLLGQIVYAATVNRGVRVA